MLSFLFALILCLSNAHRHLSEQKVLCLPRFLWITGVPHHGQNCLAQNSVNSLISCFSNSTFFVLELFSCPRNDFRKEGKWIRGYLACSCPHEKTAGNALFSRFLRFFYFYSCTFGLLPLGYNFAIFYVKGAPFSGALLCRDSDRPALWRIQKFFPYNVLLFARHYITMNSTGGIYHERFNCKRSR